jgi:hypothetical protein
MDIKIKEANDLLNLKHNKLIFVYSQPKVGSTSLVSSLRIFCNTNCNIIHIHDENMLKVLKGIENVTINELIAYNRNIGKEVYVIDVYRSPIERKMSSFFEKVGSYHFNNIDSEVNNYDVNKVINRFNKIFPYIGNGDHFLDIYPLTNKPEKFDNNNKYLLVEENGIKYIKLRLKDSSKWGHILCKLLQMEIYIVKDYETTKKPIKDLYLKFKEQYKIPINYLNSIKNDKYLNYYYSSSEINEYYELWKCKSSNEFVSLTEMEYKIYEYLTLENCHLDYVQVNKEHYIDEGCICKACVIKRNSIKEKIKSNTYKNEKIIHEEAKKELLTNQIITVNKINEKINNVARKLQGKRKDFRKEMVNIVNFKKK